MSLFLTIQPNFTEWLPFLIIILCLILSVVMSVRKSKKKKINRQAVNQQIKDKLQGFIISKEMKTNFDRILVDDVNKKLAIITDKSVQVYNFSDILDFELNEDGESVSKGKGLATAVGGLTFGVVGAIAGASGKRKNKAVCTFMIIRIMVNNLNNPQVVIPLISTETRKDSIVYKSNLEIAKDIIATLTYISNQNAALQN